METNEDQIHDALQKAGIPYEVLRTEDGWLEIGFCIKEEIRGHEEDCPAMDGFGCRCGEGAR
jgi:hypothetical protein